jgi:hypothetical protein
MQAPVEELVRRLHSPSPDDRGEAALSLGLLFELNSHGDRAQAEEDVALISPALGPILLGEEEQADIVGEICDLISKRAGANAKELLWILSKAPYRIALAPLIRTIGECGHRWESETCLQALFALDSCIFHDYDGTFLGSHASQLKECNILQFMERCKTAEIVKRMDTFERDLGRIRTAMDGLA